MISVLSRFAKCHIIQLLQWLIYNKQPASTTTLYLETWCQFPLTAAEGDSVQKVAAWNKLLKIFQNMNLFTSYEEK